MSPAFEMSDELSAIQSELLGLWLDDNSHI